MIEYGRATLNGDAAPGLGAAPLRVLLVEDNPDDARLVREMLNEVFGGRAVLDREDRLTGGLNRLKNEPFDILLLGLCLPDSQGLEALEKARSLARTTPVVVLTRPEDAKLARAALNGGARDYLVKGEFTADALSRSIRYALGRHSSEEALRGSEAALARHTEELKNLLTVAAHELRHPATVFKGYSYILLENADHLDSEAARDALRSIDRASDRIARIVNELMDASVIERGELSLALEEVEPFALLNRVESEFRAQGARISISDETDEGAVFMADREKLRAVLANLVENAVKFSPAGQAVDVIAETAPGGVLFFVRDRGPGISGEHREQVFERFYQVQDAGHHSTPGLGLGLFITRTLVEAHGGWIKYSSREGGGSIFEFFIPGSVAQ